MICPTCGGYVPDGEDFCNICCHPIPDAQKSDTAKAQTQIPEESALSEPNTCFAEDPSEFNTPPDSSPVASDAVITDPVPSVPVRKGRRWPAVLVLCLIFLVGFTVFLLVRSTGSEILSDPHYPWFALQDGKLYFDESRYTGDTVLKVPASIQGRPVTVIGNGCFSGTKGLIGVELPGSIRIIEDEAFAGSVKLRGVFIPVGTQVIGQRAFYGCMALESLCIPESVETIGDAALAGCGKLNHIFYGGSREQWKALYSQLIAPKTTIYTAEGAMPHRPLAP